MPDISGAIKGLEASTPVNRMPISAPAKNLGKINKFVDWLNVKFKTPQERIEFLRTAIQGAVEAKKMGGLNAGTITSGLIDKEVSTSPLAARLGDIISNKLK